MVKKLIAFAFALALATTLVKAQIPNPKIYIAPADGFESYLEAGITKKNVPAQIVTDEKQADYILHSVREKQSVPCGIFSIAKCASIVASIQLIERKTSTIAWAYSVHKFGAKDYQSSAEACAKHLKQWLEHTGN